MFVALLGVISVTGFVLFFVTSPSGEIVDTTPIVNTVPTTPTTPTVPANPATPNAPVEPNEDAPVCGNNEVEGEEDCESDSDCSSNEECSSCACITINANAELLDDIEITDLVYWCPRDFDGESGLAVKIFKFKNNGSDFSYDGRVTLKSESVWGEDSITTNNAFDFEVDGGKTIDIYQKDLLRSDAPYLFLGNKTGEVTITFEFGDEYYIEHTYTLRGQDFADANCQ